MQLKSSTDYGIRAVYFLAAQSSICSSRDIAEKMDIPRDYLIQLAQLLRNAGVIDARPGKHGGYCLAKKPSEISVLDVISALSGEPISRSKKRRTRKKQNGLKHTTTIVEQSFDAYLGSLTFDKLIECTEGDAPVEEVIATCLAEESTRLTQER